MMAELVAVANFRTRLEAEWAARLLELEEIPSVVQSPEGAGYGPLPPGSIVYVAADDAERAREVLQDAGLAGA
jgi:hypothetical protein